MYASTIIIITASPIFTTHNAELWLQQFFVRAGKGAAPVIWCICEEAIRGVKLSPGSAGVVLRGALKQPGSSQWLTNKVREIGRHLSERLGWMSRDSDLFPQGCADPGKAFRNYRNKWWQGPWVSHGGRRCCRQPRCSAPHINLCWEN